MTDAVAHDAELDASGLNCPLPLLKAKLELNRTGQWRGAQGDRHGCRFSARLPHLCPIGRSYAAS